MNPSALCLWSPAAGAYRYPCFYKVLHPGTRGGDDSTTQVLLKPQPVLRLHSQHLGRQVVPRLVFLVRQGGDVIIHLESGNWPKFGAQAEHVG